MRQETYGRYDLARQWYSNQRQLQGIAKGLAQLAGPCTTCFLTISTQRSALVLSEVLHRRMQGVAPRRHLTLLISIQEPQPMIAAEHSAHLGVQHVFHPLRPLKRTRSTYDMEAVEAALVHQPGLTPSDGREWGKRP